LVIDKNIHQTVMNNPVSDDLQPAAFTTKAACRASLQRRELVNRVESKLPKSKQL
jgi:hypothetical protein